MSTVFINGRFLGQRVTGIQRYAREVLACMDAELSNGKPSLGSVEWALLVPRGTAAPTLRTIAVRHAGFLTSHLWEQIELPWYARSGLLLNFGMTGPLVKRNQIITIHDANVVRIPDSFSWFFRLWYRFLVPRLLRRCPLAMAVSGFSAREAATCFGAVPERLRLSTEGWQHLERIEPDESILERYALRDRPFALAVSSPTPNKNFSLIPRALAHLGEAAPVCVVAGSADPRIFPASGTAATALLRVGYVSDGELKALYRHATCFIFPSFYEGFGIPSLEAMACGCPVLGSTAEAIREVCGDAALYFNPDSAEELATRIRAVFSDSALRAGLVRAGKVRITQFSWREAARRNLAAIEEVSA